jgi:iron(II)-dependent oxidoreductase
MAYCARLQQQLAVGGHPLVVEAGSLETLLASGNWQIRLPTEGEWEKAAGWDPVAKRKRVYAWGDDWNETKANVAHNVGSLSAVGVFPADVSACGALDMTGNIWEWTLSQFMDYPYQHDARHNPEGEALRALRGGAWLYHHRYARVSSRNDSLPVLFNDDLGFRLVLAPVLT